MKNIIERRYLFMFSLLLMVVGRAFADYEPGERFGSVTWIDSHWDEESKQVVTETKNDWIPIRTWSSERTYFGTPGKETWYAIEGKFSQEAMMVNRESPLSSMTIYGEVHLILLDESEVTPLYGIHLEEPNKLHIHVQSNGEKQGRLIVSRPGINPAIGAHNGNFGELHIHGGYIDLTGGTRAAGIGTAGIDDDDWDPLDFNLHKMGKVFVYDGTVKVHGGDRGAGIGGGAGYNYKNSHSNYGEYTQYGGDVTVWGGETAAGIGGGGCYAVRVLNIWCTGGRGMKVNMYGGKLTAYGGRRGAGIGSGNGVVKVGSVDGGTLNMYGGQVYAKGGDYGAGIGGGCNAYGTDVYMYGGTVNAIGGTDAAGIGGGESGPGQTVVIDGGTLRAEGNGNAAGIGGGEKNIGMSFTYKKGSVIAIAGEKCRATEKKGGSAIGSGKNHAFKCRMITTNAIHLATDCKVTAGDSENNLQSATKEDRERFCRWRNFVKLETCEHKEYTYTTAYLSESQHRRMCKYCNFRVTEDHTYPDGEHCACGKTANKAIDLWTVAVKHTTDGKTYTDGTTQYAVRGKSCTLPQPADVEGLIFMGYMASDTAPESIEMKDDEMTSLVDAGQTVTPTANTTYYARYRYDYSEDWTWSDDYESAIVKISNSQTGESKTITANVQEDESERIEAVGNELGMMTFRASAEYKHNNEVTYQFSDRVRVEYFNTAIVDLDAAASDNEEILESHTDQLASVSIINMTLKKDGKLHPLCLPFTMSDEEMAKSPLAGATLYHLSSSEMAGSQLQLTFKKATDGGLNAGEPYFVKWESGTDIENPEFYGVRIKESSPWIASGNNFYLYGTFDMEAVADEEIKNGTFLKLGDGEKLVDVSEVVVDAFSNFLYIPSTIADDGSTAVCSVRLSFEDDATVEKHITYGFDGEGTAENPYVIINARQLNDMSIYFNAGIEEMQGKYFKQGANLTFDKTVENNYTPVNVFNGHYDGDGYVISGLNINKSGTEKTDEAALFVSMAENSTLKNTIIANSTITGRSASALVNTLREKVLIDNCHVLKDVTIRSNYYSAAGLVAYIYSGSPTLKNSTSHATVISNQMDATGIVSNLNGGTMTGCCYLGKDLTHGVGAYHSNPIVTTNINGTINDCYYTDPSLSDSYGKLMPYIKQENTTFLDLLHARDEFLLQSKNGLTEEQISYDLTINGREYKAVKNTDETWSRRAFTLSLPFDMAIPEELHENVLVYRLMEIDLEKKEFIFTNDFPILKAGWPYILVVNKGSITFSAKNILAKEVPMEPEIVHSTDNNRELGYWCGTFKNLDNERLVEENAYVMQRNGTFRHIDKIYSTKPNVGPFLAYFSAEEPIGTSFKMKFVKTENGVEEGNVTDFPADMFDSECDVEDITGVDEVSVEQLAVSGADAIFNLSGQKVTKDYKGIIIKNGRKMVIKN